MRFGFYAYGGEGARDVVVGTHARFFLQEALIKVVERLLVRGNTIPCGDRSAARMATAKLKKPRFRGCCCGSALK